MSGGRFLFTWSMQSFPSSVASQLGYYVYLYLDPRDDKVFYVGKGANNRAFYHLGREDGSGMAERIAEIREAGFEPKIEILAHGLPDAETALRVEAAAIDLLKRDTLENRVNGWGSREFGRYSVEEIAALYCGTPARIRSQDKVVLIRINRNYYSGISPGELYEVTRGVWKLSLVNLRARQVEYAFAVFDNVVREVYAIQMWFSAGRTAYFHRDQEAVNVEGRVEFVGRIAPEDIRKRYLLKSVDEYFVKGNANPIQFVNC